LEELSVKYNIVIVSAFLKEIAKKALFNSAMVFYNDK